MSTEPEITIKVFISYAHVDQELRKKLEDHLSPLKRAGKITIWQDQEIPPGANWEENIHTNINQADLILLLVSASFIASNYCWNQEVKIAFNRHQLGKAKVIPIILRPALWEDTPLGQLQALPTQAKPITQWHDQDAAFEDVARGIQKVVEQLRGMLREEALRNEKINHLKDAVANLYQSFTLINERASRIESKVDEQNKRKQELEAELLKVNALLDVAKTNQLQTQNELGQMKKQLQETSEQLVSLGGELDRSISRVLILPFQEWKGPVSQRKAENLDFARGISGWSLTGETPGNYIYGIDPLLTLNGKACSYLKSRSKLAIGFGTLAQAFQGTEYRGRGLRLSALIKTQGVEQWTGLWMRIDDMQGNHLKFDNMSNRPIQGTVDVRQYEVVLDVPHEYAGIYFGVLLAGTGQVWLSDVKLELVESYTDAVL